MKKFVIVSSVILAASFLPVSIFYIPLVKRAAAYDKLISPAFIALETANYQEEKFLGMGSPGFDQIMKLIIKNTGFKPAFEVRGITNTKGIVFLCMNSAGEDIYTMVAPMSEVQRWAKKESVEK